ncbi:hypothetical protein STEG23_016974 [Scotinomys teguina]
MQLDRATNNCGRTMEVVAAAPRCQLLLIMLMTVMLLPGMKVSPLLVWRKIASTIKLQENIGKGHPDSLSYSIPSGSHTHSTYYSTKFPKLYEKGLDEFIPFMIVFQVFLLFEYYLIWKQLRCPSTEEWINKMWYIYAMEYFTAEKNSDIMKFSDKWMELENVILSEVILYPSVAFDAVED